MKTMSLAIKMEDKQRMMQYPSNTITDYLHQLSEPPHMNLQFIDLPLNII